MLRENKLSTDLADRVDSYGQIRLRPIGNANDIEGYPPLSDELRTQLENGSWKFPANLSLAELEDRLEERLLTDHELAEVSVTIDRKGRVELAAASSVAGLSRRVPAGKRAVSISTLLPTGLARGDSVTVRLPDGDVTGPVVSARTTGVETPKVAESPSADETETDDESEAPVPVQKVATTAGGEGQVTVALSAEKARRVIRSETAPIVVHSRGKQREYEAIGVLNQNGNQFRKVTVGAGSSLAGSTIGNARIRDSHDVAILAIRRLSERIVAPRGTTELQAGDALIVVGKRDPLRAFEGVAK